MPNSISNIATCVAPFTGRIGARQVSIGSLIAGSRAATSPTTLLTTLVSLDPLYLDFDMSESDFLTFSRERARIKPGPLANKVLIALSDENSFTREGNARLHRQCARSLQRHHSRARHGAEPGPVPGARPVRATARCDRAAHAGLSPAGCRRRARPVAAPGDDGRRGWNGEAEDRDDRRAARRIAGDPVGPRGERSRRHRRAWCAPFPAPRSRRRTAPSSSTPAPTGKADK